MEIAKLFNALPSAGSQGVIWGIMAIGVYITYRILDVADLTVDGSIATGGAVAAVLIIGGCNVWVAMVAAFLVGMLAGLATGIFHTFMGIPAILAGILTQLSLYSINLRILGGKANMAVSVNNYPLLRPQRARAVAFQPDLHSGGAGRRGDRAAVLVLRHGARLLPARNRRKRQHGARAGHQHQRG